MLRRLIVAAAVLAGVTAVCLLMLVVVLPAALGAALGAGDEDVERSTWPSPRPPIVLVETVRSGGGAAGYTVSEISLSAGTAGRYVASFHPAPEPLRVRWSGENSVTVCSLWLTADLLTVKQVHVAERTVVVKNDCTPFGAQR